MRKIALELGQQRSDKVREQVRNAMVTIEQEMAENDGVYPRNKGAVTSAELARRATIHPTTLHSPKQRVLLDEVKQWIATLKSTKLVGRGTIRRDLASRIEDYKRLYEGLAQSHRDTELLLQQTQAELSEALKTAANLREENSRLRFRVESVGSGQVVTMPWKKD